MTYIPQGPYRFQSGKKEGQCAEILKFSNPKYLSDLLNYLETKCGSNPSIALKHLRALDEAGDNIIHKITRICRCCEKNKIQFFSLCENMQGYGISIGPSYAFCQNQKCQDQITGLTFSKTPRIVSFQFSNISECLIYNYKFDYRMIGELYKWAYGFKTSYDKRDKKITAETAFELFFR